MSTFIDVFNNAALELNKHSKQFNFILLELTKIQFLKMETRIWHEMCQAKKDIDSNYPIIIC
jgi:hypothetical protein